ncbi:MAG TPA: cryptochrome/photolyase family protein, partial [Cellvibrionaceae bacterium]
LNLDDTTKDADLPQLLTRLANEYSCDAIEYQRPDEYRLAEQLKAFSTAIDKPVRQVESEHFLLRFTDIDDYFTPNKHQRMEAFYRKLRMRFNVLMHDDKPEDNQWNFDADNRQALKAADIEKLPEPLLFNNDISRIKARLSRHGIKTIGRVDDHLLWPINRQQSRDLLAFFCQYCLPFFGRFQDAMTAETERRWSLYHSRLAFALNSKMLSPLEVINTAIGAYRQRKGTIELAQIEGFVRQILGWREYVRGVYWANMPGYAHTNQLQAERPLPGYYWHGNTRMHCMNQAINQSLDYAYAHHIQRLMVTGNFCLLAGIHPDAVDSWYLGIYIDAIEWVEMPNTRGMSQFADGGLIATKPYAASGNYIQRMSDYCKSCFYDVKQKTGERACPFNSLYWNFLQQHREQLSTNHRTAMMYRNWDRMEPSARKAILSHAQNLLADLDGL